MTVEGLVSIILPVFNGADYLTEAIDSCLAQTYSNFELIIVNDASTDTSTDIVAKYQTKDTRIKLITNKTNSGLPASLNFGFKEARGEFLTWTSHDNNLHTNFLEVFLEHFKAHPKLDFLFSDYIAIDDLGRKIGTVKNAAPKFLPARNVVGASFIYKKEVYQKVGDYSLEMYLVEDYDYWLRVYKYFKMGYLKEALYDYRLHSKSLTKEKQTQIQKQKIKLRDKFRGQFRMSPRVKGLYNIYHWYIDKKDPLLLIKALAGLCTSLDLALLEFWNNRVKKAV